MTDVDKDRLFLVVYGELARLGHCDGPGGMECERVTAEWIEAGRPDEIKEFIRRQANTFPDAPPLSRSK